MYTRKNYVKCAQGQGRKGLYVVVCCDEVASDQIAVCLQKDNQGQVLSYDNSIDLAGNLPTSNVDLLVIAGDHSDSELKAILKWARRSWSKATAVVIGDPGDYYKEIAARSQAAFYLTRPTMQSDWDGILDGVAHKQSVQAL